MEFTDKVAVVTGASSGIGRATAVALARAGALVVAVARREDKLRALIEEIGQVSPRSTFIAADMGERHAVEEMITETIERYDRLDILINNAGIPMHRLIYRISVEDAERTLRINFQSCLWACFAAIPHMLKRGGGTIVNVSSFGSIIPPTHEALYVASKCAMNGFTRGLWNDLAGSGIHAVLLHPGPIATEIWDKVEEEGAYSGKTYPPEVVARDILWAIQKQAHEVISPRRNFTLGFARWLNFLAPALVRKGVASVDAVDPAQVEHYRTTLTAMGDDTGE